MRLTGILVALLLAAAAMAWSAMPPGDDRARALWNPVSETVAGTAAWRRDAGDGRTDFDAARRQVLHGDPARGANLMVQHGCGACHIIPGIRSAQGTVGPSLRGFASRAYIAGILPNEPGDLTRWLLNPPAYAPRTAMPALGLTVDEARDMAAYLLNRRGT
ncbi:c-type cytochrome [Citreimonas salinaria]|uniref:Cytochrome c2 n=1 Tax=Citreimonas salinaria TaxID=321339 RepID=A0A1H3J4N2_9RHOB|nr:c-type cytochrome [Citreimonas salinaria]SDY34911.1 Cytochrome c2 [Citreimonas salinaria]